MIEGKHYGRHDIFYRSIPSFDFIYRTHLRDTTRVESRGIIACNIDSYLPARIHVKMIRIILYIIRTKFYEVFQQCSFRKKQHPIQGYRIISTEYYRYLTFNDRPSTSSMCFVSDSERAWVFRDLIEAFPYIISMDCRFTFEPVIRKTF